MTSHKPYGVTTDMKRAKKLSCFKFILMLIKTTKFLAVFLGISISMFLTAYASADTFRGKIDRIQNRFTIYDNKSHHRYELNLTSSVAQQQMNRLDDGDYVAVSASVNVNNPNLLDVISIDFVGLSVLIGAWKSNDGLCYNFIGYTTFNVYVQPKGLDCDNVSPLVPLTKYTYFINPDSNEWNMLISSKENQLFGRLKINNSKSIEIQLLDSETNAILGTVILRR